MTVAKLSAWLVLAGEGAEQLDPAEAARIFEGQLASALLAEDGQLALSSLAASTVSTLMPKVGCGIQSSALGVAPHPCTVLIHWMVQTCGWRPTETSMVCYACRTK